MKWILTTSQTYRMDTGNATPITERLRTPFWVCGRRKTVCDGLIGKENNSTFLFAMGCDSCNLHEEGRKHCMDYRKLNSVTHKDALPLPRIESCIDQLRGTTFISCLDMFRDR